MSMKINNIQQNKIGGSVNDRAVEEKRRTDSGKSGVVETRVSANGLSRTSQLISMAKVAAGKISDIREDRVEDVKRRLADGYYDSPEVQDELAARITDHLKRIQD